MIPIKLTLEGIYSYQKRQIIDFQQLTTAGLFGIFGETGSGKSSILEAITYALYGETERLNKRDRRGYNMMNLKSDKMYIALEFTDAQGSLFKATRETKRSPSDYNTIYPASLQFYAFEANKWIPIDKNAEEILGLSYENFKRTIIIPQGKFREFIELTPGDRTKMLKEIFNLDKFDLFNRTTTLYSITKEELNILEGQVLGLGEVSKESIDKIAQAFAKARTERVQCEKDLAIQQKNYEELKAIKEEVARLDKMRKDYKNLEALKPEYDARERRLREFQDLSTRFKPLLHKKDVQTTDFNKKTADKAKVAESLIQLQKEKEKKSHILSEISSYYAELRLRREEENDLKLIIRAVKLNEELTGSGGKEDSYRSEVEDSIHTLAENNSSIKNAESQIEALKGSIIDPDKMLRLSAWYDKDKRLKEDLKSKGSGIAELRESLKNTHQSLESRGVNTGNYAEVYARHNAKLEVQEKQLRIQMEQLHLKKGISEYADMLHNGNPCPLCGSTEHPHILESDDVTQELSDTQYKIDQIQLQRKELNEELLAIKGSVTTINSIEDNIKKQAAEELQLQREIEVHKKEYIWPEFSDEASFLEKKEDSSSTSKRIKAVEKDIQLLRSARATLESHLEKKRELLDKIKTERTEKETELKTLIRSLRTLNIQMYLDKEILLIAEELEKLKKKNDDIEAEHSSLIEKLADLNTEIARKETLIESLDSQLNAIETELRDTEEELRVGLQEINRNTEDVQKIISVDIDIEKELDAIQKFQVEIQAFAIGIQELEEKMKGLEYNEEIFMAAQEKLETLKQALQKSQKQEISLEKDLKEQLERFKILEDLLAKKVKLENREENLKTMLNLFKGAGFVEYVSSIYLQRLCHHANKRFRVMTNNQLMLLVDDQNNFEIIDYLNEGRQRSVKTLSGGQYFQVSLSLALALAESVQVGKRSSKNFFFIDEGFGTQDGEAVNIVFETLLSLNKENKIVGIISHVDALKEQIPASLTIVKDEKKGSIVKQ